MPRHPICSDSHTRQMQGQRQSWDSFRRFGDPVVLRLARCVRWIPNPRGAQMRVHVV
ncbi:hypothetical protein B0H17DRAFT_1056484 [Mycena rosella]|uniref:Uncharacterized protein n=1 Tax=Mycena rosella TaxID=1033263 RepID=A0AAD7DPJ1_MYCRO|nr:hypothetical protein B0H17DRAFT_1056484 [Mycena rosella]